jgi:hypothetical protein
MSIRKPKYGELNSADYSQDPVSLEPDNFDGIDLISESNNRLTKPNVLKKLIGPLKGIVIKGVGDQTNISSGNSTFDFIFGKNFAKHRIRIPEIHAHLPEPEDYNNVPQTIASLYPEFIAQDSNTPQVNPGTIVWCNFLDRENMLEPVYLGPVDKQAISETTTLQKAKDFLTGLSAGSPAAGSFSSGQSVSPQQIPSINSFDYAQVVLQEGSINKDVFDAAKGYPDGQGGLYNLGGSGVIETIYHKGDIVLKYTGSTYCNGASFTIAMNVINKRNLFANKTLREVKRFQQIWYGADPNTLERQQGPALEYMGIGKNILQTEAIPGDFAQIWRTNNSGHSVVFLGWAEENGKIVGINYRSSQGKGPGSGVGNRTEYFSDTGKRKNSSVVRERTYISRIII